MIGKQIPAGTGFKHYKNLQPIETTKLTQDDKLVDESVEKFFEENADVAF